MSFYYRPGDLGIFLIHGPWMGLSPHKAFSVSNYCDETLSLDSTNPCFQEADESFVRHETFKPQSLVLTRIKEKFRKSNFTALSYQNDIIPVSKLSELRLFWTPLRLYNSIEVICSNNSLLCIIDNSLFGEISSKIPVIFCFWETGSSLISKNWRLGAMWCPVLFST